jgi:hypothetical protein
MLRPTACDHSVLDIARTFAHLLGRSVEPLVLPIETYTLGVIDRSIH